jgi:hypothetical protein
VWLCVPAPARGLRAGVCVVSESCDSLVLVGWGRVGVYCGWCRACGCAGCVCRLLHVGCALGCVWCRNRVSRVGLCVAYLVPEYVVEALVPGDIRLACELHKQFNEGCVSAAVLGEEVVACCH